MQIASLIAYKLALVRIVAADEKLAVSLPHTSHTRTRAQESDAVAAAVADVVLLACLEKNMIGVHAQPIVADVRPVRQLPVLAEHRLCRLAARQNGSYHRQIVDRMSVRSTTTRRGIIKNGNYCLILTMPCKAVHAEELRVLTAYSRLDALGGQTRCVKEQLAI